MKLKNREPAPDFTLQSVEGITIPLSDVVNSGQHVLLVFLRHLG